MTTKTRREFTDEFEREAVAQLEGGGRPLTQVAAELGIDAAQLAGEGAWRRGTVAGGPARDRTGRIHGGIAGRPGVAEREAQARARPHAHGARRASGISPPSMPNGRRATPPRVHATGGRSLKLSRTSVRGMPLLICRKLAPTSMPIAPARPLSARTCTLGGSFMRGMRASFVVRCLAYSLSPHFPTFSRLHICAPVVWKLRTMRWPSIGYATSAITG